MSDSVTVSKASVFLDSDTGQRPGLSWVGSEPQVFSRLFESQRLPTETVTRAEVPEFAPGAIYPDLPVYREGEPARLLFYAPLQPGSDGELELRRDGRAFLRLPFRLDRIGQTSLVLPDLGPGLYEATWGEQATRFEVVADRAPNLCAKLLKQETEGPDLRLEIEIRRFGVLLSGGVWVELHHRGSRRRRKLARISEGRLTVVFEDCLPGPLALVFENGDDVVRLPLAVEQPVSAQVELSQLGEVATLTRSESGGLLKVHRALAAVRCVVLDPTLALLEEESESLPATRLLRRARRLLEAGQPQAVLRLLKHGAGSECWLLKGLAHLQLECQDEAVNCLRNYLRCGGKPGDLPPSVADSLPHPGNYQLALGDLVVDEEIELELPSPVALVFVAGFLDGQPWEGWVLDSVSQAPSLSASLSQSALPEAEVALDLSAPGCSCAYVCVRDRRRAHSSGLDLRLDKGLESLAHSLRESFGCGLTRRLDQLPRFGAKLTAAIIERLLAEGFLATEELAEAQRQAEQEQQRTEVVLWNSQSFERDDWIEAAEDVSGLSWWDLDARGGVLPAEDRLPPDNCRRLSCLPLGDEGGAALLAMSEPGDEEALSLLAETLDRPLRLRLACADAIERQLEPSHSATESIVERRPGGPRAVEGALLFSGPVELHDGAASLPLELGSEPAQYEIEALFLRHRHWHHLKTEFEVPSGPALRLDMPSYVHPGDEVEGVFEVLPQGGGRVRVALRREQTPLALSWPPDAELGEPDTANAGDLLSFPVEPGFHQAGVMCNQTGQVHQLTRRVESVVRHSQAAPVVRWLGPDDDLGEGETKVTVQTLRLRLAKALAELRLKAAEATAIRLLGASVLALESPSPSQDAGLAEGVLLACQRSLESRCDGQAARHLRWLELLESEKLAPAAALALKRVSQLEESPEQQEDDLASLLRQSWAQDTVSSDGLEMAQVVLESAEAGGIEELLWAGSILYRWGEERDDSSLRASLNRVLACLTPENMLASPRDSLALLLFLWGLDGEESFAERTRLKTEDWQTREGDVPLEVRVDRSLQVGQSLGLEACLQEPAQPGDVLWVCLPQALQPLERPSRGQRFRQEFHGASLLTLELVAVKATGSQHGAVFVSNLYEPTRCSRVQLFEVKVDEAAAEYPDQQALAELLAGETEPVLDLTRPAVYDGEPSFEDFHRLSQEIHDDQVVKVLDFIFARALERQATHIHLDVTEPGLSQVLFRHADGLSAAMSPPIELHAQLVGRLQLMARLGLGPAPQPQQGVLSYRHDKKEFEWPLAVSGTAHGQRAVVTLVEGHPFQSLRHFSAAVAASRRGDPEGAGVKQAYQSLAADSKGKPLGRLTRKLKGPVKGLLAATRNEDSPDEPLLALTAAFHPGDSAVSEDESQKAAEDSAEDDGSVSQSGESGEGEAVEEADGGAQGDDAQRAASKEDEAGSEPD